MTHPLTRWREKRDVTMERLAQTAGISKGFVSMIEAGGSFSIDTGLSLVSATGGEVTLVELVAARRADSKPETAA